MSPSWDGHGRGVCDASCPPRDGHGRSVCDAPCPPRDRHGRDVCNASCPPHGTGMATVSEKVPITGASTRFKYKFYVHKFRKCVLILDTLSSFRSRIMLKQERRKQKEFFEKKKLKSKMKLLEVSSSPKSSAVSLDLLNLYVVNQISTKKDDAESVRKPIHIDMTGGIKIPVRRHNIELPMSPPRVQYTSNLDDIQNRLQKQVLDSRRQHLSEKVKYQHNFSQVTELTYADSSMEHEDNSATAFSACPSSSSVFWSSNCTQSSKENFNTNLMWNPWEQSYEEKQEKQAGNISDQGPWISKPPSQCIFRKSDTVPQELFKPLNRPDYMNSASKNPVIMTNKEPESNKRINEPFFGVVKETAELTHTQDEHDCSFLAMFEDESQPVHNSLSTKHFNPFVIQSSPANFFINPDDRNQTTNRSFTYDTGEVHPAISAKRGSVDRHLKGIFTAPEQVLLKSNNVSRAGYEETREPQKSYLQNYHKRQYYFVPCENKEKPAKFEKNEAFTYHHDQQINLKENVQNHSRKKSDSSNGKESAWRQDQLFGFEEFATAPEKEYKFGVRPNLHELEKDIESSLSSQSPSYSPRQTDSCFSSSPDMSEEEDTANKKEFLNEQSFQIGEANLTSASASTEPLKTSRIGAVPLHLSRSLTMEESNHLQHKHSISPATEEENKEHPAPPESSSLQQALKREQVAHSTRADVWSQTESSVTEARKVDVATQCDTLQTCSCRSSCPCARSAEVLPPLSTAGTAGGHKMPGHAAFQPAGTGSAAGIAAFSSEAEYLSLADSTTLEVLNYIHITKEREKQ
ncbi:uncharacterized protein C12orf40 homolog [Rhea pennata]|uniref:uncharacterized protein C12orf40 homolog n=1 Tax=Rhea pennata TaxID=8795 RepID=UPI002E2656CA